MNGAKAPVSKDSPFNSQLKLTAINIPLPALDSERSPASLAIKDISFQFTTQISDLKIQI